VTPGGARAWVEGLEVFGMRFGLERMGLLLEALGHPERGRPAIHVVGSNGKSSTARLAAAALLGEVGSVGTYLSPHVLSWRERIEVDGRAVSQARFAAAIGAVREAAEGLDLEPGDAVTQFEALTAAAFWTFARAGVGAAVVEAGLGGRFDATNVLAPDAVVALTNIALEHTDLLGETEEAIAGEKLAVAAPGAERVVIGRLADGAAPAVAAVAAGRGLRPWWHGREIRVRGRRAGVEVRTPGARYPALPLPLAGDFQRDNLATAIAAVERLLGRPPALGPLRRHLAAVRMPGRLEVVGASPLVVLDGAHNPAGMAAMARSLPRLIGRRRPVVVLSALGDKDLAGMLAPIANLSRGVIATRSHHPRAVAPQTIAALAQEMGAPARVEERPAAAVALARALAGTRGAVVVCGSLYLLADVRPALVRDRGEPPAKLAPVSGSAG
jgi:dihydrofolate synthase/folylpolyglutamate synthase